MKKREIYNAGYVSFIVFIVYLVYYLYETNETVEQSIQTRTLDKDGFCVLHNRVYTTTTDFPCSSLREDALRRLPSGYTFVDYVYKIQNVALSTFHRDVTSSKNIYKTAHPVYTLILYKSGGDLLSVCPGSNKSYPFVWSNIVNISGEPGTAFLFDCDLLHAGCTNQCQKRDVIQYKICHADDLDKLPHLQGVRANKTDVCEITTNGKFMRKLSFLYEFPINYLFYPLMIKRENSDSIIGKIQSYIPIQYYNNV
jgi:hypothetical protein